LRIVIRASARLKQILVNALSELRELPSGSLRLTAGRHAVETVSWPALLRLNTRYPDIKVEASIEPALTDIVTEQYDAGVRRGNRSPGHTGSPLSG
jgi:DNA-binding transcriptional LysR family regulator